MSIWSPASTAKYAATTPDLIAVLDSEIASPITTEALRYGMRVAVIGIPCAPQWREPAALALVHPRTFGYDIDYVAVEERFVGKRKGLVGETKKSRVE